MIGIKYPWIDIIWKKNFSFNFLIILHHIFRQIPSYYFEKFRRFRIFGNICASIKTFLPESRNGDLSSMKKVQLQMPQQTGKVSMVFHLFSFLILDHPFNTPFFSLLFCFWYPFHHPKISCFLIPRTKISLFKPP